MLDRVGKQVQGANGEVIRLPRMDRNGKFIFWRKPHSFSKGVSLFVQASTGLLLFYCVNFFLGGRERLSLCFDVQKIMSFGPVGAMFGLSAVFSFMAQGTLSPGSYALYAQAGIVIIPIMWRCIFCKPLATITWFHIVLIASGILMYFVPNLNANERNDSTGLMWVAAKVLGSAIGTIGAEMFLKTDNPPPLTVSMTYILPWKAIGCLVTCPIIEWSDFWDLYPHRMDGLFHDWNWNLILIIGHNLGDTCMSAVIAFMFDSVVKAICGIVGIICPTWIVSCLLGWERISFTTLEGQLQLFGGLTVILGALTYSLGRSMASEIDTLKAMLAAHGDIGQMASKLSTASEKSWSQSVLADAVSGLEVEDAALERKLSGVSFTDQRISLEMSGRHIAPATSSN